jgi:hypothetical protein
VCKASNEQHDSKPTACGVFSHDLSINHCEQNLMHLYPNKKEALIAERLLFVA